MHGYRIDSRSLGKTIYLNDLTSLNIGDMRSLYHEVYADCDSMINARENFSRRIENDEFENAEAKGFAETKLNQIGRKLSIYKTFCELIERDLKLRSELHSLARTRLAITARQAGFSDAQINLLLDPMNCIDRIITLNDSPHTSRERKTVAMEERVASLRNEMIIAKLCEELSKEFDADELAVIQSDVQAKVEQSYNWVQLAARFSDCLPDLS